MIVYVNDKQSAEKYEKFISSHPKGHFVKSLKWVDFNMKL